MESGGNIILFPDFEKLREEVERLRTEVTLAISERDELIYVVCKNIEAAYLLQFGPLEYRAYELDCSIRRLMREAELIRERLNREEAVDLAEIRRKLDEEFLEYKRRLEEKMAEMAEALRRSQAQLLSEEETKELKRLYRQIVKRLHPDLVPDLTETQKDLFLQAVEAYERGDLDTIRFIAALTEEKNLPETMTADAMQSLRNMAEHLRGCLSGLQSLIRKLKETYPYTAKELLDSPEACAEWKATLEARVESYKESEAYWQRIVRELEEGTWEN